MRNGDGEWREARLREAVLAGDASAWRVWYDETYLEQQSVDHIAGLWHETPKAIESLLSRARAAFRENFLRQE